MSNKIKTDIYPAKSALPREKFEEIEAYIDSLETTEGALVQILHKAQGLTGYLPSELQLFIARKLGIPAAEVYGVVSFYSYFTTNPVGKHIINVCLGTACFVRGADELIEDLKDKLGIDANETTSDGLFTLKDVRCIGACGLAPLISIDDKVYGRVEKSELDEILENYK